MRREVSAAARIENEGLRSAASGVLFATRAPRPHRASARLPGCGGNISIICFQLAGAPPAAIATWKYSVSDAFLLQRVRRFTQRHVSVTADRARPIFWPISWRVVKLCALKRFTPSAFLQTRRSFALNIFDQPDFPISASSASFRSRTSASPARATRDSAAP